MTRTLLALALMLGAPQAWSAEPERRSLNVWATAYNSTHAQTDGTPNVGAWGDNLDKAIAPGLRVIAVSQDLLAEHGLRRGQRVRIHGLKGEFVVLDKMPKRWKRKVDIYMQKDIRAARKWGRRRVRISWTPAR